MFIKRNRRRSTDSEATSILLVQGERVEAEKRSPGRPRKDAPTPKTRVVHRVVANLSKLPEELIELIDAYCKGQKVGRVEQEVCVGPCYGQLGGLLALAKQEGIVQVLGNTKLGRLALFLVLARVVHRGSRLSAVRWAQDQAVAEVLGLGRFDEDELYAALDWLHEEHERIEIELANLHKGKENRTLFLYDVTSSYLEGQHNELAAAGYNRDAKRYKKQVVVGLLTDEKGEPLSVRVYPGNTADPTTVHDPIRFAAEKLGAQKVVFVGDRGMLKTHPRETLAAAGFGYLTALTDPQVRTLLKQQVLQMDLFDEQVAEVQAEPNRRLLLKLNPRSRQRDRQRREDQLRRVREKVDARNALVLERPRIDPQVSLRQAQRWLNTYRLGRFIEARLQDRCVELIVNQDQRTQVELLDGCYVLETDAPSSLLDAATAHERYMGLQEVERDFRTMKTGLLEIRPLFLRKASRTRAHALVTMLALKLARALSARVQPLGLTADDAITRLGGVRLVTYLNPAKCLWQLPTRHAPVQQQILDVLPPLPVPMLSRA